MHDEKRTFNNWSLAGAAMLALAVSGCHTFDTPTPPPVEDYLRKPALKSESATKAEAAPEVAPEQGNLTIKSLTVDDCVRIALDKNPLHRAARDGVAAAMAFVGESKASYYPDLSASASYSRWERHAFLPNGLGQPGMPTTIGPTDDWAGGLRARYTLFDSGERLAQLRAALSKKEAASEEANAARQDIALAVHQAYYGHIAARVTHTIAEKNLTRAEDHLRLAKERFDAGAVPQVDVFRAQVEVSDARLSLVKADNLVRVSRGNLNTAMGLPVELPVDIAMQEENPEEPSESQLLPALDRAVHARPEVKAALQRVASGRSWVDAARSTFGPKVRGEGQVGRRDTGFFPQDDEWLVGISIEQPLFSGFARRHELDRAKAELSKEEAQLEQLLLQVRQEVWTAFSKLREANDAIRAAKVLVEHAQESLRVARERYASGAGTIADLLDSETALFRAEANETEARWDYQVALAAFKRATGNLVPEKRKS
jgi:outer membrane protein TolC